MASPDAQRWIETPPWEWDIPPGAAYEWFVARPAAILLIIIITLLVRWLIVRTINRLVRRASEGAIPTVLAVRTTDAKLIQYPGHEEWTELYDLQSDPYETKNLVSDPGSRELLARMQAEFDKQSRAAGFHVPEFADKVPEQNR